MGGTVERDGKDFRKFEFLDDAKYTFKLDGEICGTYGVEKGEIDYDFTEMYKSRRRGMCEDDGELCEVAYKLEAGDEPAVAELISIASWLQMRIETLGDALERYKNAAKYHGY